MLLWVEVGWTCVTVLQSYTIQHTCSLSSRAHTCVSYGDTEHGEATLECSVDCHVSRSVDQVVVVVLVVVVELSW